MALNNSARLDSKLQPNFVSPWVGGGHKVAQDRNSLTLTVALPAAGTDMRHG